MLSIDQIKSELNRIADKSQVTGEAKDFLVSLLTYGLFHEQLDLINAVQENNLSSAVLMNSKIRQCMNVMYPVYRGKNARVKLKVSLTTPVNYSKFDMLFSSNSFKVYSESSFSDFTSSISSDTKIYTIYGILCKDDIITTQYVIDQDNKYYLDIKLNDNYVSNASEDMQIFINGTEYEVTRNFYDYIQQVNDPDIKLKLFALTIPDYGIRLFKRYNFSPNDTVVVKTLTYTTSDDIFDNEFQKINIPGTLIRSWNEGTQSWDVGELDKVEVLRYSEDHQDDNGIIIEVPRDNAKSLLQSANIYSRLQNQILSKSDINGLFNESFREFVLNSINYRDSSLSPEDPDYNKITIFYIPLTQGNVIPSNQFNTWVNTYKSYFISDQLFCKPAILNHIIIDLEVIMNQSIDISDSVNSILSEYANRICDPTGITEILNKSKIYGSISKIPAVGYIKNIQYTADYYQAVGDQYVIASYEDTPDGRVPMYYDFSINILYRTDYEIISQ